MIIVLTGFMGAGKTTLLQKWSTEAGWPSWDLDHELAREFRIEPHELGQWIETHGWPAFRKKESEILKKLLKNPKGFLALGGGAFHEDNLKVIEGSPHAVSVWLDTPVEKCWERVEADSNRPLVKKGKDSFVALHGERLKNYSRAKYRLFGAESWPAFDEFCKKYKIPLSMD